MEEAYDKLPMTDEPFATSFFYVNAIELPAHFATDLPGLRSSNSAVHQ